MNGTYNLCFHKLHYFSHNICGAYSIVPLKATCDLVPAPCSSFLSCHSLFCSILPSPHYSFKLCSPAKQSYLQFVHASPLSCLHSFGQTIFFLCGIPATTSPSDKILFILQSSFQMSYLLGSPPRFPLSSKPLLNVTVMPYYLVFTVIAFSILHCNCLLLFLSTFCEKLFHTDLTPEYK